MSKKPTIEELLRESIENGEKYAEDKLKHALVNVKEVPKGCFNCEYAMHRFNNGNGAITCGLQRNKIIHYGHEFPTERADGCPLESHLVTT